MTRMQEAYNALDTGWQSAKEARNGSSTTSEDLTPYLAKLEKAGYTEVTRSFGSQHRVNTLLHRKRVIHNLPDGINILDFRMDLCSDPDIGGYEGWVKIGGDMYHAACDYSGDIHINNLDA